MHTNHTLDSGKISILKPRKALNKAFLKVKPNRSQIEQFKQNLIQLVNRTNDTESEEFHKNLVTDFLKKTYYDPNHFINTKGRTDLVIHNGNKAKTSVGVIIEAKKPTNKSEMLSREKINCKAFQELVLYYLRERITHKNLEVKYVVATNINEWFIFDANLFEKAFAQNKKLVAQFTNFEAGRLAGKTTDFFYKEIAEPFIAEMQQEVEFTHFDIRNYEKPLRNNNPKDDNKLISLFKLLSPEHLLKLPFLNDSNSLDKRFYGELLHIIGLTETKQGGKKIIERQKAGQRNTGSFLENAIIQLDSMDKIGRLDNPAHFGETHEERLFSVGLELSITWLNRILFLKLLEAQLLTYHKGDKSYEFLSLDRIHNYDDLNSLFFQVLARQYEERNEDVKALFEKVPYLNSSLFEPTDIEHATLFISNLRDDKTLPIYSATVLKDKKGKKRSGELNALAYLFEFLNAYDFSSEGGETIQEDNKTLINASVLGLIFEKINGYKDGSFFTPGFITMYMCRETIRKAVVQKFNETKGWNCKDLDALYDKIEDRQEANELINSLKICDPAVGSGHFLVSALNEMIAIKNDLNILQDRHGRRLKEYHVEVVNDELIVTDDDGELFEYNPSGRESQRVQEALFHEKQNIIENCLFGVDINPNSVKICRLRLWIELLKHAYYKNETELETLPNIDINIKCGNSLISRFDLDADLSKALKDSKWSIDSYRVAVDTYRNAHNKEQKREMEKIIHDIKNDFRSEISTNDPKVKRLEKVKGELFLMANQTQLFEQSKREKAAWNKKLDKLGKESKRLETQIQEIKDNKIYENAFEWRFEFPEVLDDNGDYVGFDVVIGNPPYGYDFFSDIEKKHFKEKFSTVHQKMFEASAYFTSRSFELIKDFGAVIFICPNNLIYQVTFEKFRKFLIDNTSLRTTVNLGDKIFAEADVPTCILSFTKAFSGPQNLFYYADLRNSEEIRNQSFLNFTDYEEINQSDLYSINGHVFGVSKIFSNLIQKLYHNSYEIDEIASVVSYGIGSGGDKIFKLKNKDIEKKGIEPENVRKVISGSNIHRYKIDYSGDQILYMVKTLDIDKFPKTKEYLTPYKSKLSNKRETKKGILPWWCLHWPRNTELFQSPKIVLRQTGDSITASLDTSNLYVMDSVMVLKLIEAKEKDYKIFLGLLNSKLNGFLYKTITQESGRAFAQVKPTNVRKLLIPKEISLEKETELENLVSELESCNGKAEEYEKNQREIDRLVYELYGLTEEEIQIIENSIN